MHTLPNVVPQGYIFRAKNFFGMRDQQEVVLTPNTSPLGEQQDTEALKQKYLENTYGIGDELSKSAESVIETPIKTSRKA